MAAQQQPFPPRAGYLAAVPDITVCEDCGYDRPLGSQPCPVCGFEPGDLAALVGAEYPGRANIKRFKWVFAQPIPSDEKLALLAIVEHDYGQSPPHPSVARLATMTGLSERKVKGSLKWLRERGWLIRRRNFLKNGCRTSNSYTVTLGALEPIQDRLGARRALGLSARRAPKEGIA